jgi:demethylmenaquinone methyltransferase/2-methoxy-6-polyprenyl-1,4-benzoquinol methylase
MAKPLNLVWRWIYDRLAGVYDAVDWLTANTTHRYRRRALPYLPDRSEARVLEVGAGTGKFHVELARRYDTTAAIDLALGMARRTHDRLIHHGLRASICQGNVYALPWPDDHFDAVVSTFVLSAVPDLSQAMDEMIRVTTPGGVIVVVDAGESERDTRFAHVLAQLWEAIGDYIRDEVPVMEARGLDVTREEYGPGGCVHVVAGSVPESRD